MTKAVDQCIDSGRFKWMMPGGSFIKSYLIDLNGKLYHLTTKCSHIPHKEEQILFNIRFIVRVHLHDRIIGYIPDHACCDQLSLGTRIYAEREIGNRVMFVVQAFTGYWFPVPGFYLFVDSIKKAVNK